MKKSIQGVVFDIDGVIVDTRHSYLEAICLTTELYLEKILGIKKNAPSLLSLRDVEYFKMLGGFNNDWDCVVGLLFYFLSHLKIGKAQDLNKTTFRQLLRHKNIAKLLRNRDRRFLKNKKVNSLISRKKVVQIFQEVYLGQKIYASHYKCPAIFWKKPGLYTKETPLLPGDFFKKLKDTGLKLGIATGRTSFEARMALDRLGYMRFFDSLITADDVEKAERKTRKKVFLSKPHPYVLLESSKRMGIKRFFYVGDLPDDMKTATAARKFGIEVAPIGFVRGVAEKHAMRRGLLSAGAATITTGKKELESYLIRATRQPFR